MQKIHICDVKTGQTELYVVHERHLNPPSLNLRCGCDTISAFKAKQTPGGYRWLYLPNPYYPRCGYVFAIVLSYSPFRLTFLRQPL